MEINTFWKIVLRLAGLWLLHDCLYMLPQLFTTLALMGGDLIDGHEIIPGIAFSALVLIIYLLIIWLLFFKTNGIISFLGLNKHFNEQRININLPEEKIITIIVVTFGAYVFIDGLIYLCREIMRFFQQEILLKDYAETSWMLYYFLSTAFGYLIITNGRRIGSFIQKQI